LEELFRFFSPEAARRRRTALDSLFSNVERFIPPNLRPAAEFVSQANPVVGMGDAITQSRIVFDPEQTAEARRRAAIDMGIEMAMSLTPAALARLGYLGTTAALAETFATPTVTGEGIRDAAQGLLSDATYAAKSVVDGDPRGVIDAFRSGDEAQSLSAMATNTPTPKELLDPQRLSKVKLPSFVGDIDYRATPTGDLTDSRIVNIEDLQGTTLIPAFGDRTYGGATLEEIQGIKLDSPVQMQGGHDFMRDQRTGLWASEQSAMSPKSKFIDELISENKNPRMIYTAMGGQSADFSHHMADATMGLIEQSNITKKAAKEYDDIIKEKFDPDWPGILSNDARRYLHNNMTGTLRRELWQEMDKGKWQKMGFPHLGVARASITDPDLLTVEPFTSGLSIGQPSGGGLLSLDNKMPHLSYDSQIGGDYLGRLENQVPGDIIFRDFFSSRREAGIPTAGDQRSFMMSPYTQQLVDQRMVDEVSRYLENLRGRM
jgi:hypothetical protein